MPVDKSLRFICECFHDTHNVKFLSSKTEFGDDNFTKRMYVVVSCRNHLSFWRKLKECFNYIFRSHSLEYEEVLLTKEDCKLAIDYMNKFIEDKD